MSLKEFHVSSRRYVGKCIEIFVCIDPESDASARLMISEETDNVHVDFMRFNHVFYNDYGEVDIHIPDEEDSLEYVKSLEKSTRKYVKLIKEVNKFKKIVTRDNYHKFVDKKWADC